MIVRNHGEVEAIRFDNASEFTGESFVDVYNRHRIRWKPTIPNNPRYNGIAEHELGIIQSTEQLECIHAPPAFHDANVLLDEKLWA